MKCVIPGSNLRVFGKTVHALSRFGDDIYIEPLEKGLALKTVNSSRSAFAFILFSPAFFISYEDRAPGDGLASGDNDDEPFRCRVTAKSCLRIFKSPSALERNVDRCTVSLHAQECRLVFQLNCKHVLPQIFKSPSALERNVDRCTISLYAQECRLVFQLNCKHGIVKTFSLTYQETETLQAVFAKDLSPNHITADARALGVVSSSFKPQQEEVTMTVNPSELSFRNYVEDEPDPGRVTHSELRLPPDEFTDYSIGVDTEVTFCLKEFKAILALSETVRLPINVRFETTGKPIVFSFVSEGSLEGTFVLATLADLGSSQTSQLSQRTPAPNQHRNKSIKNTSREKKSTSSATKGTSGLPKNNGDIGGKNQRVHENGFPEETGWQNGRDNALQRDQPSTSSTSPVFPVNSFAERLRSPPPQDTTPADGPPQDITTPRGSRISDPPSDLNSTFLANFLGADEAPGVGEHRLRSSPVKKDVDSDDEFDFVPSTPPAKKFKSMFFGSTQSQVTGGNTTNGAGGAPTVPDLSKSRVLAADSDDDD